MKQILSFGLIIGLAFTVGLKTFAAPLSPELKAYKIDPSAITISGVSSGAFMAIQMDFSYSATFSGAASVAGGVYGCARGDSQVAQTTCMRSPQNIVTSELVGHARALEGVGKIDATSNLGRHRFFLYASPADSVVNPVSTDKLKEFLLNFVGPTQIAEQHSIQSAHGFPTLNSGSPCQVGASPWLLNCNYDGAGDILRSLYPDLSQLPTGTSVAGNLQRFSQRAFAADASAALFDYGWVYVPSACQAGEVCKLHVALHGCQMNPDFIQDQFARHSGYNDFAEASHVIVLYPQAAKSLPGNPFACWDWFGVSGPDYDNKNGPQMAALKAMIDQISASSNLRGERSR